MQLSQAERTRDGVKAANNQYDEVIRIAAEKGSEYVSETEIQLGRVLTVWEKLSLDVGGETLKMSVNVVSNLRTMYEDGAVWFVKLKNDGITSVADLSRGVRISTQLFQAS